MNTQAPGARDPLDEANRMIRDLLRDLQDGAIKVADPNPDGVAKLREPLAKDRTFQKRLANERLGLVCRALGDGTVGPGDLDSTLVADLRIRT